MIIARRKKVGIKKIILLASLFGAFLLVGILMIVLFKYLQEYGIFFSIFFFASSLILLVTLIDYISKRNKNNLSEIDYCLKYDEEAKIIYVSDLAKKVEKIELVDYRAIKKNDDELLLTFADAEGVHHEIHLGFSDDILDVRAALDKAKESLSK